MAITNAQQYKQLLAKGGRIGLANGSRMDSGEAREARGDKSDFGGRDERRPDMLGVSRAVEATNKPKEQPNLFSQIGTGLGNYIKGGGMIGMVGRGLGSLFGGLTGPTTGFSTQGDPYGNAPGGLHDYSNPGPTDERDGGDNDNENRNLYATTNQYTVPTAVEEGITTLVNNPDFIQRFRVKNPFRQDKQGQLDPQIIEMINNLYT